MESQTSFEKALVAVVTDMLKEKGIKHSPFGRFVFGETSGVRLWRIAREEARGKTITVNEFYRMAEFFEQELPEFVWKVCQRAKEKGLL